MNYYARFMGDYGRDTRHLTLAEHGAYTLLLDHYYATERPLPNNLQTIYRLCGAEGKEREAVRSVLEQFFPLADDGLRHNWRADEEIPKAQRRIDIARENGKKGGRRSKEDNPAGNPAGSQRASSPSPSPTVDQESPLPCSEMGSSTEVGGANVFPFGGAA